MPIVPVSNLATELPEGATPFTLRWFRNGVEPSGIAARRLAEHLNVLLAQRQRAWAHSGTFRVDTNTGGTFEGFDTETNSDIVTYRLAFRTGPVTRRLRVKFALLTPDSETTATATPYVQWVLETGLTGSGSTTNADRVYLSTISALTDQFTLNELVEGECILDVASSSEYRMVLHQVNRIRVVSCTIYEEPRTSLDTSGDAAAVDTTQFVQGRPITGAQIADLYVAAEKVWSEGQPLAWWTADVASAGTNLAHEPRSRTSATQANVLDQTYTAVNASAPGFFTVVPYSGTLDSANVPAVFWAYASCVSGTGTITFRDQAGTVLATITPAGAAAWYAVEGNLTENTTKVDVLFAGDATNTTVVHAFGAYLGELV